MTAKNTAISEINKKQLNSDKLTAFLKNDFDINPAGIAIIIQLLKEQNVNSDNYIALAGEILL